MRRLLIGFTLAVGLSAWCAASCAASDSGSGAGAHSGGGSGGKDGSTDGGGIGNVGAKDSGGGTDAADIDAACTKFSVEAKQAPAAVLFVLDGSASMNQSQKWSTAQLATVSAIDKSAFDNIQLGLVRYPSSFVDPPQCFCDYVCAPLGGCDIPTCKALLGQPGVACGISALPQVPIADSGTQKSNQGGVRKSIYDYLAANSPITDSSDASPIYDAMVAGYAALANATVDRRVLILITDGGFSCTSVSSPARPGYSDGACPDWEEPDTVNALISGHYNDPTKPIYTFIIGVPGSDSTGQKQGDYATAPYNMLLALSTYAVSGAPDSTLPAGCDKTAVFSQTGAAPTTPCHIDLTKVAFNADQLASSLDQIRGKALGCVYDIPAAPPGEVIDKTTLNVFETLDGALKQIPKRPDGSTDPCTSDGCWDFKGTTQVELIGKACDDLSIAKEAKVDITVGCVQLVK